MKMLKFFVVLASLLLALPYTSSAQETTVTGAVRDINSHKEISNVNIFVKGNQVGTVSDQTGKFSLFVIGDRSNTIVVFQHIAFEPLEVSLDS
ncbi:MAG: carboxypeptidase-like regulatory domain-containing protein, partial [bacterium]